MSGFCKPFIRQNFPFVVSIILHHFWGLLRQSDTECQNWTLVPSNAMHFKYLFLYINIPCMKRVAYTAMAAMFASSIREYSSIAITQQTTYTGEHIHTHTPRPNRINGMECVHCAFSIQLSQLSLLLLLSFIAICHCRYVCTPLYMWERQSKYIFYVVLIFMLLVASAHSPRHIHNIMHHLFCETLQIYSKVLLQCKHTHSSSSSR